MDVTPWHGTLLPTLPLQIYNVTNILHVKKECIRKLLVQLLQIY